MELPGIRERDHEADFYSEEFLRRIFAEHRVFALVGASPDPSRPSHGTMAFLQRVGFRVIPVNPREAGSKILGEPVRRTLADIPEPVDVVDVFRKGSAVAGLAEEAIAIAARVLWLQLGIVDLAAAERAEEAGLSVVMNRCPQIEYPRLFGRR
jgi:predicted CoA-binding protein